MSRFTCKKRNSGFTLIEIMIVVLIIAVLLAIAIPNFLRARETSRAKSCQANLRQLETAKEQWAMDWKKGAADTPTKASMTTEAADCGVYIKTWPTCPGGGADYEATLGDMTTRPTCSIGAQAGYNDHVLP